LLLALPEVIIQEVGDMRIIRTPAQQVAPIELASLSGFNVCSRFHDRDLNVDIQILFELILDIRSDDTRFWKVRDPKRGDVMVFEYPEDPSKDFIKRVVGTPGDTVEVKDKKVYVNGAPYENPHEVHKEPDMYPKEQNPRDNMGPVKVPADSYFMMGDNRDRSYDSRFWGFVKSDKIKGLAFIKYWSWDNEHFRVRWRNIGKLID